MAIKIGEGKWGPGGSSDVTPDFAGAGYRWSNYGGGSQAVVSDALRLTWDTDPVGSGYYGPTLGFYVDDNAIVLQDVYLQFQARFPTNVNGCKFVKFFGRRSEAEGYSNATFNLLWNTGEFSDVLFTDGTDLEGDAARKLFFSGGNNSLNVGRAWGTAVISTPQNSSFDETEWGNTWHTFKFRYKQNSGTSSGNEVADGVFYVEIDGNVYLSATNMFNRNPLNLQGLEKIEFGGWSQDGGGVFDLDIRNVVISTGGFFTEYFGSDNPDFGTNYFSYGSGSGTSVLNKDPSLTFTVPPEGITITELYRGMNSAPTQAGTTVEIGVYDITGDPANPPLLGQAIINSRSDDVGYVWHTATGLNISVAGGKTIALGGALPSAGIWHTRGGEISEAGAASTTLPSPWSGAGSTRVIPLRAKFTTNAASDTTPNSFSFNSPPAASPGAVVTSDPVTITGIDSATPVSVSGGLVSINGGAFVSSGTISNGQTIVARVTASNTPGASISATVDVGGVTAQFTVVTSSGTGADQDKGIVLPMTGTQVIRIKQAGLKGRFGKRIR